MALVRCSKHNIPYNEENPRGCPACALENSGDDQAAIVRQLVDLSKSSKTAARASRASAAPAIEEPQPGAISTALTYVSAYPRVWGRRVVLEIQDHPAVTTAVLAVVAVLTIVVARLTGPQFIAEPHPAPASGESLPLPLLPGQPVTVLFAMLGAQPPSPHPTASGMERYTFDDDIIVDAVNGIVHSISIETPGRTWQSLRVGMGILRAEGALALLGAPTRENTNGFSAPEIRDGYLVFPSLHDRPRQVLTAQVRPPNGCYDVEVVLQPYVLGILEDEEGRFPVVGRENDTPSWVVTKVSVASRAVAGPNGVEPVC